MLLLGDYDGGGDVVAVDDDDADDDDAGVDDVDIHNPVFIAALHWMNRRTLGHGETVLRLASPPPTVDTLRIKPGEHANSLYIFYSFLLIA